MNIDEIPIPFVFDENKKYLAIEIPKYYLISKILPILQQEGGRVKDTAFNKVDVNINNLDCINGGMAVFGEARLQHRELLTKNPFTGKNHYTPWISISGSFGVSVNAAINNEVLQIGYRSHQINFDGKWYAVIADAVVEWFFKDRIIKAIKSALNNFNDLSIRKLFNQFGSSILRDKLEQFGVSQAEIDARLPHLPINANFSETAFVISIDFSGMDFNY